MTLRSWRTAARRTSRRAAGNRSARSERRPRTASIPTKNLGALGDGGALTTSDERIAAHAKRLRNGGQTNRYQHVEFGVNSRLDEMQAAILRARLTHLPEWTRRRRALAHRYRHALAATGVVTVPPELDAGHVYHLFPVLASSRDQLQVDLRSRGVETLVHYPIPIPRQPALAAYASGSCPVAEQVTREVLSLPLYPSLPDEAVETVAAALRATTPR